MISHITDRVAAHTSPEVQARIDRRIECSVTYFAQHPMETDQRLDELDAEWDIERILETNASALSLFGLTAGIFGRKRWLLLPLMVQGFLLQHAVQGWCPPIPLLRRLGIRTREEIDRERYALKVLRGDFRDIDADEADGPRRALSATD